MGRKKVVLEVMKLKTIKTGDMFMSSRSTCLYLVAQVARNEYKLICLQSGNRWDDSRTTLEDVAEDIGELNLVPVLIKVKEN